MMPDPRLSTRFAEMRIEIRNLAQTDTSCAPVSFIVATMSDARAFSRLARMEAERRGVRNAAEVIGIHDGGNWIDPLWEERFSCHTRILDYFHAAEHLHDVAKATHPAEADAQASAVDA